MNKEAFLHQLESSLANNDKKLFAKTIYDLPADVIVGFTKEEFSRIISISHQFSSQKMDRLFNSLENKGSFSLKKALKGIDELNNSLLSKFYCSLYVSLSENNIEKVKRVLLENAIACDKLAEMGIDSRENLETAVCLYSDAREIFPKTSAYYAIVLMNEGNARQTLAEMGIDSIVNLETAVLLYGDAREILPKTSADYARALMNEVNARLRHADMGIDSRENLETAVSLYGNARGILSKTSADYARALVNEGNAIRHADMGIDSKENFEISKELYLESILILEKLGDGWLYSIALLYFNDLLKDNFYKTGEKKYLEEWEENLGDIEKKIKDRDIRYKELLMARIHEIRASLLEFDGKSGINKASREYDKAYELSKYPFYKFMDEFCQARTDNKSFCELVSDWKEVDKEGIFLDYFDYTVFECHLENSLKNTIDEENELKLAVEKLKEIRDRTQIKIVKDRVSAYIYLLQALVDCFNKDSYTEAAKNVKEGCRIFRECGDKPGQQMCEIFHKAVVKRTEPDAWQEIIRNREFSSNFYSLLCEYSNRKRADLEFYRSGQIFEELKQVKEISIRTEMKVDQLRVTLNQGFAEIKDQIEERFNGTDAELEQIKGKIDTIQQGLDNLVQISNDIGGKEGECVREFALKMLELVKKRDYEALKRFIEKIVENEASLEEIIEKGKDHRKEKEDAKSKLADFKKILCTLSENVVANLTADGIVKLKDVAVALTAEEIVKLLVPVLSTAVFGVPIPSKIIEILLSSIRNS